MLFRSVRVRFEFGTEHEFNAIQEDLAKEANSDGTPPHATPQAETQPSESTPSTSIQNLESLIPKGQIGRYGFFRDDAVSVFPTIRQRLPDGTYEGQASCIYLGNVPFELLTDKRDIWRRFKGFGEIRDIRIREYCGPLPQTFSR